MREVKLANPAMQEVWDSMTSAEKAAVRKVHNDVVKYAPEFTLQDVVQLWWWQSEAPLGKDGAVAVCAVTGARFRPQGLLAPRAWKLDPTGGWEAGNVILINALAFQAMKATRLMVPAASDQARQAFKACGAALDPKRDLKDPLGHNQHIKLDTP